MNPLPIVRRELLLLSRRRWFYWLRTGVAAAVVLISLIVFATSSVAASYQAIGAPLFMTISVLAYFICLLAGPVLLADSIAEERRSGTLGLLFLANTNSLDIVGGKFVAMALPAAHCLLATLPILAIAFFLGGVTGGEFLRSAGAMLNVLFFSLASAALCSVLAASGRRAFGAALLATLTCGGVLPLWFALNPWPAIGNWWPVEAAAGPGLALWFANDTAFRNNPADYYFALNSGQVLSWIGLLGAMMVLPFRWHDQTHFTGEPTAWQRWLARCQVRLRKKLFKTADPVTALARHRLGGPLPAWIMTIVIAGILAGLTHLFLAGSINGLVVFFAAYALHGVFKVWVGWVANRAFGPERDSGALELLLTTPLGETAVWRAWLAGLRGRFLFPALALIAADIVIAWQAAFNADGGMMRLSIYFLAVPCLLIFLLDCHALCWSGLWHGLNARNATRACIRSMLPVLVLPGLLFAALFFGTALAGALDEDMALLLLVAWLIGSFVLDVIFTVLAMSRLSHDCREAVVRSRMAA
jgi:ABC-type transport system involved in multi-copper enzyme maturation permease subunit